MKKEVNNAELKKEVDAKFEELDERRSKIINNFKKKLEEEKINQIKKSILSE